MQIPGNNPRMPHPCGPRILSHTVGCSEAEWSYAVLTQQQETALTQINVVLNWFEELKRRVPAPQ